MKVYRTFEEIKGFSRVVSLDEIRENEYNLNVTLYVFPEEEVEEIDVREEWMELRRIESEIEDIERRIENYVKQLY